VTAGRMMRVVMPTLVVMLIAAVVSWLPARSTTADARARTDSALRIVDDLSWELDDLGSLVDSVDELKTELAEHDAAIPPDHQLAEFILDLESLADVAGIDLIDVVPTSILTSFDDPATPAGTSSVVVAVALNGGFGATIEFLDRLSALPRLVVAESIAVGFDEIAATLAIDLELRVFTTRELVEFTDEFLDDLDDDGTDEESFE